jgi:predicted phage replisome organizer
MRYIKLPVHFFKNDKLKAIRSQKDGDTVILLYIMLITIAVKSDSNGQLMLYEGIPYDEKILSGIVNLPLATVKNGLEMLVKFGFLTVTESIFSLVNYNEYADVKMVKERRQNADRQARFKAKKDDDTINAEVNNAVTETTSVTAKKPAKPDAVSGEA